MREPTPARGRDPRPGGIVDTLSAGYGVVNRRPWIVLFPVLLDLFLWFGPQVSVAPLVGQALSRSVIQRGLGEADADAVRRAILVAADELNVLALLAPGWVSVPAIVPLLGGGRGSFTFAGSWSTALLVGVGALIGGVLLGSVYRSIIANAVRAGTNNPTRVLVLSDAVRAWVRLLGLAAVLVVGGVALGAPAIVSVTLAGLLAQDLGSFGLALLMTLLLWLQLYLFFAPEAIFVSRVGPLQAIRRSFAVVRANFWATAGIAVLITIILLGMGQVWVAVASRAAPWGTALGILGNAYIASGLVAASMLFYSERTAALPGRSVRAAGEV